MNAVTTHPVQSAVELTSPTLPKARMVAGGVAALIVVVALATSFHGHGDLINTGGFSLLLRFLRAAPAPALDADMLSLTATSTLTTVAFALCGSAISLFIGAIGGVFASEAWWDVLGTGSVRSRRIFRWAGRCIRLLFAGPRGVHELVWGLLLINVLGLDPLVGVLAIGLPFGAITAKVFAETLDEMPRRTAYCLRTAGAPALSAFAYGILPRAIPLLLSYALYRVECAIRSAAVLGLIGAGGLGYQVMLSLQSLRYEQVWTFLYALMILVALTDWGNSRITLALRNRSATTTEQLVKQTRQVSIAAAVLGLAVVGCAAYLNLNAGRLFEAPRLALLRDIFKTSFPPRLPLSEVPQLVTLSFETLAMSVLAVGMAAIPAMIVSWLSSTTLLSCPGTTRCPGLGGKIKRFLVVATRSALIGFRGLSDGIWVLLVLFVFFPGMFAGAVALAIYNFGVIGRILSQANETAEKRSFCTLRSQGASVASALFYGVIPVMLPKYLAYILYRWEVCLRATVVVGIAGAGGLGARLEHQLASFDYRGVTATLIFFVALTIIVDILSSQGRRALRLA